MRMTTSTAPSPTAAARLYALVPCAGVGLRAGGAGPKQYIRLAGEAVVGHTLRALYRVGRIERTLVALHPQDDAFEREVPGFDGWVARVGGASRAETVANGLAALRERGAGGDDWALVHDAARCLLQPQWVDALIDACLPDAVGGLLAMPLSDTLKQENGGRSSSTLDRNGKWLAQTPQMFRIGLLEQALRQAGAAVTDEASAVESLGRAPLLVPCGLENIKLTYPADFQLAERLLRTRA